jgi:hypothetical protein
MSSEADTAAIRKATKLYTETWIIPVLEAIEKGEIKNLDRLL